MLICFDLDDTLLDYGGAERAAAQRFAEVLGEPSAEVFVRAWRAAAERHIATFLRGEVSFQEQHRLRTRELTTARTDGEADALFEVYLEAHKTNLRRFDDWRRV